MNIPLDPNSWGFTELEVDVDLLSIGKFGLRRAAGIFPDGSPFRMPDDDPLPVPIEISLGDRDQALYLTVARRRAASLEVDKVGALLTRGLVADDETSTFACVPVAQVVEYRPNKQVVLDDGFIPTVLRTGASGRLATILVELLGLLHQRGDASAGRVVASGRGGVAELADFLVLQTINSYEPLVAYFADVGLAHPEELYQVCLSLAGELATFTSTSRRPLSVPSYRHDRLRESFEPLIAALRSTLSVVLMQSAVPIPIEPRKYGISVAIVPDRTMYGTAVFILAARAEVPFEELRRRFPTQVKIGPAEKIADLVRLSIPGVSLHALPVAPRQIPHHTGFAYFELDQTGELWDQLKTSGTIALHIAGEFPGLALELWGIRG